MKSVEILTTHTLAVAFCCVLGACSAGKSGKMVDTISNIKPRTIMVATPDAADEKKLESEDKKAGNAALSMVPTAPNRTTVPDSILPKKTDANGIPEDENGKLTDYSGLSKSKGNDNSDKHNSTEEASGRDLSNYFTDNKKPKTDDIDDEKANTKTVGHNDSISSHMPIFSETPIDKNVFGGTDGVVSSTSTRTLFNSVLKGSELSDTPDNKLTLEFNDQKITLDLAREPSEEDRKLAQKRWSPISLDNGIYLRTNDAITANSLPSEYGVKFGMIGDIFEEDTRQFYVQGQVTSMNEMPVKDVMHYRGGVVVDQAGSVLSTGINADVDFANKQIDFDLDEGEDKFDNTSPALQFKAEIVQNHFVGKSDGVQTQGAFYGKNARELAGVFFKETTTGSENNDDSQMVRGVFGLKQSSDNQ